MYWFVFFVFRTFCRSFIGLVFAFFYIVVCFVCLFSVCLEFRFPLSGLRAGVIGFDQ